jgi:hypothetical protein
MAKKKEWREGEMIVTFGLTKIDRHYTPLMQEWLDVSLPKFDEREIAYFEHIAQKTNKIATWSEEDLKMKFISHILDLGGVLDEDKGFVSFFDKKLESIVEGHRLSVKADFVVAKGVLDFMQRPFFHFQEYKPDKNPTGDPMAQLLEAFLIGQCQNDDNKPLYGCEIIGKSWRFVTMEAHNYCVSKSFDSTEREDLLKIIAILRKFRVILETRLLD